MAGGLTAPVVQDGTAPATPTITPPAATGTGISVSTQPGAPRPYPWAKSDLPVNPWGTPTDTTPTGSKPPANETQRGTAQGQTVTDFLKGFYSTFQWPSTTPPTTPPVTPPVTPPAVDPRQVRQRLTIAPPPTPPVEPPVEPPVGPPPRGRLTQDPDAGRDANAGNVTPIITPMGAGGVQGYTSDGQLVTFPAGSPAAQFYAGNPNRISPSGVGFGSDGQPISTIKR